MCTKCFVRNKASMSRGGSPPGHENRCVYDALSIAFPSLEIAFILNNLRDVFGTSQLLSLLS